MVSETDEKAIRLMSSMRGADLRQDQIDELVKGSRGCIVTAVMKGYNAGFLRGYDKGRRLDDEGGE